MPPFDRIPSLKERRFASRSIEIKENAEIDVGNVRIQVSYGAINVRLRDVNGSPLVLDERAWTYVWLRIRNQRGETVKFGSFSISDIEASVNLADSSAKVALPEGTWYIEGSLKEDKGPWFASSAPIHVGQSDGEITLTLSQSDYSEKDASIIRSPQEFKTRTALDAKRHSVFGIRRAAFSFSLSDTGWNRDADSKPSQTRLELQPNLNVLIFDSGQGSEFRTQNGPDYRIGKSIRTVKGPPTLIVHISIKPKHFNREDMILLAAELKERFGGEPRTSAWIFDSYSAARSFVPHPHSPTYDRDFRSLRGFYDLDQTTGKEYIQFSTSPQVPRNEVQIELGGKSRASIY